MRSHRSSQGAALAWLILILDSVFFYPPVFPLSTWHMQGDKGMFYEPTWLRTSHALSGFLPICIGSHVISFLFPLWAACTSVEDRLIWNQWQLPVLEAPRDTSLWESHLRLISGTPLCSLLSPWSRHRQEQNMFVQPGKPSPAAPPCVLSDLPEEQLPLAAWEHRT